MFRITVNCIASLLLIFSLAGCSLFKKDQAEVDLNADQMYALASESMAKKQWNTAIERLRAVEAKFPYGKHSQQIQLDIAYVYYKNEQVDLAVEAARRFIRLHPAHSNVDYAYYIIGLASFSEDKSLFGVITGRDDLSDRDVQLTQQAHDAFDDLIKRFPKSRYAPDAKRRADQLLETLAIHEIAIANYYLTRDAYVAVINRSKGVIENYSTTSATQDALGLMIISYRRLGLGDLENDTRRVLALNFPESPYLGDQPEKGLKDNWYGIGERPKPASPGLSDWIKKKITGNSSG